MCVIGTILGLLAYHIIMTALQILQVKITKLNGLVLFAYRIIYLYQFQN